MYGLPQRRRGSAPVQLRFPFGVGGRMPVVTSSHARVRMTYDPPDSDREGGGPDILSRRRLRPLAL